MNTTRVILASASILACSASFSLSDTLRGGLDDFVVEGTTVVPTVPYLAEFEVLGAEISYGGHYEIPVTLSIQIGEGVYEPFGDIDSPTTGNVNDGERGRKFRLTNKRAAYESFTVTSTSWVKRHSSYSGVHDSHWRKYLTVKSSSNSSNLLILRNGDVVPDIAPHLAQASVGELVKDHIDPHTGLVQLYDDEVIILFELGTTNLGSPAADFQDLVILATLAENEERFDLLRFPPIYFHD